VEAGNQDERLGKSASFLFFWLPASLLPSGTPGEK
jgi:hypothetical protein